MTILQVSDGIMLKK